MNNPRKNKGGNNPFKSSAEKTKSNRNDPSLKLVHWCSDICQNSDGSATLMGMAELGPVTSFGDLLLPANANPQTTLAAEQLIHLIEGWRYIASATNAMLSHAGDQALHLAYYAELRAAMSLFSWSGIRVKQCSYYYLDSQGKQKKLDNQKTHAAVWGLWKEWVKRPDAMSLFNDGIRLHPSVSLGDVVGSVRYVNTAATLSNWGVDLWDATRDRNARNTSSYEAKLASKSLVTMEKKYVDLVLDLWRLFLSDGFSLSFDAALINHIVADAIPKLIHQSQCNPKPTAQEQLADIAISIFATTGVEEVDILRRLNPSAYSFTPFVMAADQATNVENVLCRGYFLLRMAMLATKKSIATSPSNSAKKWMENWLFHVGLWNPGDGIDLVDIEEDYRISVEELDPTPPFPSSLWTAENIGLSARLIRPDACMAWGLIA